MPFVSLCDMLLQGEKRVTVTLQYLIFLIVLPHLHVQHLLLRRRQVGVVAQQLQPKRKAGQGRADVVCHLLSARGRPS
jgi:hypothetical protein